MKTGGADQLSRKAELRCPIAIDSRLCAVVRPADQQASEGVHGVGRCYSQLMANGVDVIGLDSEVIIWSAVSQYISGHRCAAGHRSQRRRRARED